MSIRDQQNERRRWNDPADQNDKTGIRVMEVAYALEKDKEDKEVEKTVVGENTKRSVMGEIISTQLEEGMVFHTNEYKEEKNKGSERGE